MLPKHWWEGTDGNGKKRDIGETTLEPPLGSGPYRIKDFSAGRNIVYERVKDYWGGALNVNVGQNNFDELHFEYFRDTTVALEAFKADTVDWRDREQRQKLGHRLRLPGGRPTNACCSRNFRSAMSASCRPSPSTSGAKSSPTRACGSPSTMRSISRK